MFDIPGNMFEQLKWSTKFYNQYNMSRLCVDSYTCISAHIATLRKLQEFMRLLVKNDRLNECMVNQPASNKELSVLTQLCYIHFLTPANQNRALNSRVPNHRYFLPNRTSCGQ